MADLRLVSREFLADFIDLYRQNECLWKIKSKDYSDKQKKSAAYDILIGKLKEVEPEANKNMVLKKINSLRTCFRKELKKYNASLKSETGTGEVHKPNLWYFDLLLFLNDQETPRQGRDTMNENEDLDSEDTQDDNTVITSDIITPKTSRPASAPLPTVSKKKKQDRSDEVLEVIAESLQSKAAVVGRYDAYGKHIGQELEELPPQMAIHCKRLINEVIYQAQAGALTAQSKIVSEPEPISTTVLPIKNYVAADTNIEPPSENIRQFYSQYL
nr:unnamed protein product [Callosobruchus chinensis]